jgi:hypothetical protein
MSLEFEIRIIGSARRHGLSRRRIEQALAQPVRADATDSATGDPKIRFVGRDAKGEEIEVVAVVLPRMLLIIHAMPTRYRRGER